MTDSKNNYSYTKKIWIAAGIILLTVVFFLLFKALFSLLMLTLAGVLMAVYFYGCADLLKRLHLSPKLSIILSVTLNILLLVAFFWFMGARLQQQLSQLSDTLPKTIQEAKDEISKSVLGSKLLNYLNASGNSQKTVAVAKQFFSSGFGILSDLYIVILIGLFFTASPAVYKKGIIHLLPPKAKDTGDKLLNEISDILRKWLKGQIFGFLFIAVLTGISLLILGMPLVLTLALIAGFLNLIPNFGPLIALIPALLLALTKGITTVILVVCLYTLIQIIQSAVTQPLIQKKMISIPPALVIIGQVAMGSLAGFWGVLLAAPVVAILMRLINRLYVEKQPHHKYEMKKDNA